MNGGKYESGTRRRGENWRSSRRKRQSKRRRKRSRRRKRLTGEGGEGGERKGEAGDGKKANVLWNDLLRTFLVSRSSVPF